jgi:CheY-like chemotaxis protein
MGNTILLADKSITIQKIVELTFAEDQFEIKCVNDGQSALDMIPQIKPDIILADISLPVKSGYDICQALRTDPDFSSYSETPVILLAGIYETMDEDRARQVEEKVKEVGANDLLSKPFDPQLLTTKVKDLMIQKSIGTYRSQPAGPTETFSFDAASTDPPLFADPYGSGSSFDDTGNFNAAPEEPVDDTEKTMILSVPPFSSEMFAQSPPFEKEEETKKNENPVDVDSVKPANEQLFDASDLEAEGSPSFFDSSASSDDSADSLFHGNPEVSSTEMQWSDSAFDVIPSEGSTEQEQPVHYADYPESSSSSYYEPPAVPAMDEPFGDVLGDPTVPTAWDSATASDEEVSPFGLPEPPQPDQVVDFGDQTVAYNPHENISASLPEDSSSAYSMSEPVLDFQQPLAERVLESSEPEVTWSEPVNSFVEEEPVEQYQPAETEARVENQEPETPQIPYVKESEEAEELQPDLAEGGIVAEPQLDVQEPAAIPVVAPVKAGQVEIPEELIDKIVERVIAKMSLPMISDIVWQVVPDLAEKMIRRELEKLHTDEE